MDTIVPVFFCEKTREVICFDKEITSPSSPFFHAPLPTRLNDFEIKSYVPGFRPHDDFVYLMSFPSFLNENECYLVYHLSKSGEKYVSYFFWSDTEWHVTTVEPKYERENVGRWNKDIVLLF